MTYIREKQIPSKYFNLDFNNPSKKQKKSLYRTIFNLFLEK